MRAAIKNLLMLAMTNNQNSLIKQDRKFSQNLSLDFLNTKFSKKSDISSDTAIQLRINLQLSTTPTSIFFSTGTNGKH